MERTGHNYAVRIYVGEFNIQKVFTPNKKEFMLMNIPYYLGTKLYDYLTYFIKE